MKTKDPFAKLIAELQEMVTHEDELGTVASISEQVSGVRPHPTTTVRWTRDGVRGVVLPSIIVNRKRVTSKRAFVTWAKIVEQKKALARG